MISTVISVAVIGLLGISPTAEPDSLTTVECIATQAPTGGSAQEGTEIASSKPYYFVGNYECRESDGDSAGKCQVTTHHKDSCQAACAAHRQDVRSRNVCVECVAGRRYPGRSRTGSVTFSQGGPCRGMTCNP